MNEHEVRRAIGSLVDQVSRNQNMADIAKVRLEAILEFSTKVEEWSEAIQTRIAQLGEQLNIRLSAIEGRVDALSDIINELHRPRRKK